jgi:DNA mismatch repair protein MutL
LEIKALPSDVVDQIAAGEVVDRPAHLVKELLENSLDAEASKIDVDISEGGRKVSIIDDGKGIFKEDLPLVFNRHATSKISASDDLWSLHTFGFRGEAIASISSVSEMEIISRRQGQEQAFKIECEFGKMSPVEPAATAQGTEVHILKLFENTPARKKFLKSDSAEVSQIKNVIKAVAMSHPQIQIRVKVNGKLFALWKPAKDFIDRAQQVLELKKLYYAVSEYEGFKVEIAFSDPGTTLRVSRQIWMFVQDRWVQDRTLQAAVMEAYRSLLMHGEYPYCVVKLTAPPDEVDVNVHPTKSQVKFTRQKEAFRAVHYCLREALEKAPWLQVKKTSHKNSNISVEPLAETLQFDQQAFTSTQFKQKSATAPDRVEGPAKSPNRFVQNRNLSRPPREENPSLEQLAAAGARESVEVPTSHFNLWSSLQVIGQVDLTYIVAQSDHSMFLIDQHAAHERVAFERLMAAWKSGKIEQQSYLLPLTIDLEEAEVEALKSYQADLQKMGLVIEQVGPTTISIESAPAIISEKGIVSALKKLAHEIVEKGGSFAIERAIADIFATMACHSVVRAGQALSTDEMKQLLADMDEFPLSSFCPHGRSVSVEKEFSQLEKEFGRRV